jgi:hypothetical protein
VVFLSPSSQILGLLPSKSFHIHCSYIILPFDAVEGQQQITALRKVVTESSAPPRLIPATITKVPTPKEAEKFEKIIGIKNRNVKEEAPFKNK